MIDFQLKGNRNLEYKINRGLEILETARTAGRKDKGFRTARQRVAGARDLPKRGKKTPCRGGTVRRLERRGGTVWKGGGKKSWFEKGNARL